MGRADLARLQGRLTHAISLNSAHHPVAARKAFTRLMAEMPTSSDPEVLVLLARAHLGLATSRFDTDGDMVVALEHVAAAESLAREADAPQVLVAVHGQRGLLHLGAGQTDAAMRSFDRAVPLLEHAEPFDRMRILLNRGALHLETADLAAARRDLATCADLAAEAQDAVIEFKARHNLGYVEFLAGNLPAALSEMADAARLDYGGPWATALLDRARVLREAGLFTDADRLLAQARELYLADRMVQGAAETELVRAECAMALSRPGEARRLAGSARRRFRARQNVRWERKADRLLVITDLALARSPARLRAVANEAGQLALACEREGRVSLARSVRLLQADALLAAGDGWDDAEPRPWLRTHREDPLGVRLTVRRVRARAAVADGALATAKGEVRRGLAEVSAYQARFGSLDMRTASAVHGVALARLDLELALRSGRPAGVFASIERTRAASSRLPPVRPPQDDEVAALLSRLRQTEEGARSLEGTSRDAELSVVRSRAADLRAAVRDLAWQREGSTQAGAVRQAASLGVVREGLERRDCTLVSLTAHDGLWHAALVDAGRVEHHALGAVEAADELVRRVRSDLDALASPQLPQPIKASVRSSLNGGLRELDALLLAPLRVEGRSLVVSPAGSLALLPWGLLPSRRGVPLVVSPSATAWLESARRAAVGPAAPLRVAAVAGPGLERAESEVDAVAARWSGTSLTAATATTRAVTAALASQDVVHIAAHGRHELENPLFSALRLADGPLFAHELDTTESMASCVVLSACEAGLSTVRPGNEALGLTSVLLQLGAGTVLAGVARVADEVAADVMPRVHRSLAAGVDAATALADAQTAAGADCPSPFVCFGASWAAPIAATSEPRVTGPLTAQSLTST